MIITEGCLHMDYRRRNVILAPMVRVSTLPMRLLCLEYGADIVYTDVSKSMCSNTKLRIIKCALYSSS